MLDESRTNSREGGGVSESSETIVPAAPAVMEEGIEGNELESDRKAKQPKHK